METGEYFSAWVLYVVSAFAVIASLWWLGRCIPQQMVRMAVWLSVSAVLLTPIPHPVNASLYVPALAAAALAFIAEGWDAAWPFVSVLLLSVAVALLLVLIINFVQSRLSKRSEAAVLPETPGNQVIPAETP